MCKKFNNQIQYIDCSLYENPNVAKSKFFFYKNDANERQNQPILSICDQRRNK